MNRSTTHIRRAAAVALLACLGACKKEASSARTPPSPSAPSAAFAAHKAAAPVLRAYEQVRAQLARDELKSAQKTAVTLQRAAGASSQEAAASARAHVDAIALSAGRMHKLAGPTPDALRRAFGEVSRSVVALLVARPRLRRGRHVFECPMAQGYKKWVQLKSAIENPYMGKRMLACGSASRWTP